MTPHKDALWVETARFIPFREGNVLPEFAASFRVNDADLRIASSNAMYPTVAGICQNIFERSVFKEMHSLNKIYNPGGFEALVEGRIDMFITFADKEQIAYMRNIIPNLQEKVLLLEPLAFLVHKSNPVQDLTSQQIRDIYLGKTGNWKNVGGNDRQIVTFQLTHPDNVSGTAFRTLVPDNVIDANHQECHTMLEVVDSVADHVDGLSNLFWSYYAKIYANIHTRMIKVDGRQVGDADYPFLFPIRMFYDGSNPNTSLHQFVDYLSSPEGRQLVALANKSQRTVE